MKIIHIEDYFDPEAGYQINELLYAGRKFNDDVFVITSTDMTPFHKKVDNNKDLVFEKKANVKIIRLTPRIKIAQRLILKGIKSQIKEIKPDVVFIHGIGDFKDLQLWGLKKKYIIVRDCHMSWVASKNKFRFIYYVFFKLLFAPFINHTKKYEVIYALGNEEYEYLRKLGIKDSKIKYLKHGYNNEIMYYDLKERNTIRQQYGFNSNDIVISYIGKFDYFKRPDLIFDIVDKLDLSHMINTNIKLLFIGPKEPEYMVFFNERMKVFGNKILVTVDDSKKFNVLRKYYSSSDICIFPKQTSLSSIHAQLCLCPVIMENHKSNIERVVDNSNLYAIDDLDSAALILENIIKSSTYEKIIEISDELLAREYSNQVIELRKIFENTSK